MSDEEEYSDEEGQGGKSKDEPKLPEIKKVDLDELLRKEVAEFRNQRAKEEEELARLKAKQARRKVLREKEEKRLATRRKQEEEQRHKELEAKKQREKDEKMRRLEDILRKKQETQQKSKQATKEAGLLKEEMSKPKDQVEQEKRMALSFRIQPFSIEGKDKEALKAYALEIWDTLNKLVIDTYDIEERMKAQEYDLKELKERFKQKMKQKALKLGLDPEALTGKYPPKIPVACKYERREDTRTYDDKKKMFDGGLDQYETETLEKFWKDRLEEFNGRTRMKLPRWFGERPGRKKDDPLTPEEEPKPIEDLLGLDIKDVPEDEEDLDAAAEEEAAEDEEAEEAEEDEEEEEEEEE